MSRTKFVTRHRHSEQARYWRWRDLNQRLQVARSEDEQLQSDFKQQAEEVREQVMFLMGFGDGAEQALATLAEEDMTNFCVLVDLAAGVIIPEVDPLPEPPRLRLQQFLQCEPWRSLAVDNDISVALALLDSAGAPQADAPLVQQPPGLLDVLANVLDNVNGEQFERFVEEYRLLRTRDQLALPKAAANVFGALVRQAASRLGVGVPQDLV